MVRSTLRVASRCSPRCSPRLVLERLEDRDVPATLLVVPVGLEDNVATFPTLKDALGSASLAAGDTIQIEPGSTPGILLANSSSVNNLTIQGNPAVGLASTPVFMVAGIFDVSTQTGFTLKGVRASIVGAGGFTFEQSVSILGSEIRAAGTTLAPLVFSGTANVISGNTIVSESQAVSSLLLFNAGTATSNSIDNNQFLITDISDAYVIEYCDVLNFSPTANITTTDVVRNNTFMGTSNPHSNVYTMIDISPDYPSGGGFGYSLTGLTIRDNVLEQPNIPGPNGQMIGINLNYGFNTLIQGNRINLAPIGATAIFADVNVSGTIDGNIITTPQSPAISIIVDDNVGFPPPVLKIQGNAFFGSQSGVSLFNAAPNPPFNSIDFGGGSQGSLGGNNFRSYTAAATATVGSILGNMDHAGAFAGQKNIFASGVTPSSTVNVGPPATVDVSNPLTGNAAYVSSLYTTFLHRAGDTSNPADAGGWVNLLELGVPREVVADGIAQSDEASGIVVDRLYRSLLGRGADPVGRAQFIADLQEGDTMEDVITSIASSEEYLSRQGSSGAIIQSLYVKILGRAGSAEEIEAWEPVVSALGVAALIRNFTDSVEFRTQAVNQLYGFATTTPPSLASILPPLLYRTSAPPVEQVNGWVNTPADVLTITRLFASTPEFYTNG